MHSFYIISPIVILMFIGALLRRFSFFDDNDIRCMSKTVYWIISPSILFRAALELEMDWSSQANYAAAVYLSAVGIALMVYLLGRYILKNAGGLVLPVSVLSSFRCNSIMVGIPVVMLSLGDVGIGPIAVYFAVTEAGYNLLSIFTAELSRGESSKLKEMTAIALKRIAVNPMLIASISGLVLSAFGFNALPGSIDGVFTMVANMAGGTSILMIGASLRISVIKKNFWSLLPDTAVRLFIHPALMYLCFKLFPVGTEAMQATIILTAAPAPNIAFVFAQGMGLDSEYAAGLIGMTTIGFAVSMPFWLSFLGVV